MMQKMNANIFRTMLVRVLGAALSLLIVILSSNQLGKDGVGLISLIILSISLVNLASGIAGGSALSYMVSRSSPRPLIIAAWLWSFVSSLLTVLFLYVFDLLPLDYVWEILGLSLFSSLLQSNMSFLLGREKIIAHNFLSFVQPLFLLLVLLLLFFVFDQVSVISYIIALAISYIIPFLISCFFIKNEFINSSIQENFWAVVKKTASYGFQVQASSVLALLTYRLSYFFIEDLMGIAALGIYAIGVQISEAVWLFPKSIALVQFARISNSRNDADNRKMTINFFLITFFAVGLMIATLGVLPKDFFVWVFGPAFSESSKVMLWLLPGIMAVSLNIIVSHYYSASGLIKVNLLASGTGLLIIALAGVYYLPGKTVFDAALMTTIAYIGTLMVSVIAFVLVRVSKNPEKPIEPANSD